jgi:hypothetical protein
VHQGQGRVDAAVELLSAQFAGQVEVWHGREAGLPASSGQAQPRPNPTDLRFKSGHGIPATPNGSERPRSPERVPGGGPIAESTGYALDARRTVDLTPPGPVWRALDSPRVRLRWCNKDCVWALSPLRRKGGKRWCSESR